MASPGSHDHVSLHVQGEVIGSGKGSLAHSALKGTVSSVLTSVSGQLVGPSKPPATAFEITNVRLFTSVCPEVSFEVTGLSVCLITSLVGAVVYDLLPFGPCPLLPQLSGLGHCRGLCRSRQRRGGRCTGCRCCGRACCRKGGHIRVVMITGPIERGVRIHPQAGGRRRGDSLVR